MPEPILQSPVNVFLAVIATILIAPMLTKLLNLPNIIGLILGGFLIGQHGFDLLATGDVVTMFGEVGLIYLMFNAGLEINLQQLKNNMDRSIFYASISFILPQVSGILIGRLFGLDWLASVLLGALFASQTLLAYPTISQLGIIKNEAIAITVGATVFTDIAALLVLAIVTGLQGSGAFSLLNQIQLIALVILFGALIIFGVPRLGNFFLKHFSGNVVEFQFILVILFIASALAHFIGIHAIVGAFLAGLAINRTLSEHSRSLKNILFVGNSLFVPLFMVTVGMRLDFISIFTDLRTLSLGIALTAAVYLTKLLASWIVARVYGYSNDEVLATWGLSQAQAAATMATILVGTQTGVFDEFIFDAAILTIIFTSVTSPIIVEKFGNKLEVPKESEKEQPVFDRILAPVFGGKVEDHDLNFASTLTRFQKGKLLILNLAKDDSGLKESQNTLESEYSDKPEQDVEIINRISENFSKDILNVSIEDRASLILLNWPQDGSENQSIINPDIEEIFWESEIPVLALKMPFSSDAAQRMLLIVASHTQGVKLSSRSLDIVEDIAEALDIPILILSTHHYVNELRDRFEVDREEGRNELVELQENFKEHFDSHVDENDLVVFTSMGSKKRFGTTEDQVPNQFLKQVKTAALLIHIP